MYNTTLGRHECRFCGLPDKNTRDNHEHRCPEKPATDDVALLKEWAAHNGSIVYEASV